MWSPNVFSCLGYAGLVGLAALSRAWQKGNAGMRVGQVEQHEMQRVRLRQNRFHELGDVTGSENCHHLVFRQVRCARYCERKAPTNAAHLRLDSCFLLAKKLPVTETLRDPECNVTLDAFGFPVVPCAVAPAKE